MPVHICNNSTINNIKAKMKSSIIPSEIIENRIFLIRGKKVMFDTDLARLYGVETKELNQTVRRNKGRFPEDFMFRLADHEMLSLRSQIVTSNRGGRRYNAYAFTEQGVAMLSSVLKSQQAIQVNIQIMRTFTKIREMVVSNKVLREKIEAMEQKYDGKFKVIFEAIKHNFFPFCHMSLAYIHHRQRCFRCFAAFVFFSAGADFGLF
jgi:hypothetical protein